MTGSEETPSFRLAYVPGVTPAKWVRIWHERLPDIPLTLHQVPAAEAAGLMRAGDADAGLVRLPVDRTFFSAIPLYTETTVVVVPKDHVITAAEEVTVADLADEVLLHPLDDVFDWDAPPGEPAFERPATTEDAVELVAAGVGLLVVPQSLARLYHRRDLTYRPLTDGPESTVALSWPEEATTDMVDDFIGIVRGRTVNSTRGRQTAQTEKPSGSAQASPAKARQAQKPAARTARARAAGAKSAKPAKRGRPRRRS
ncbi:LysR family substrate-binding domain-containing protein [Streptomyces shenzhenensis]|uniref:LysR family substrate-binding domain-containing protein n=1 Tax=Streptomyces shenzhenensis TaxID=943815 RepID=UPI001F1CEE32|nr:LysR family substrate-binding domain-containing protein [Streptomyces shenzhenensis]